jgi:Skp family chaperone for outer membrane proteins
MKTIKIVQKKARCIAFSFLLGAYALPQDLSASKHLPIALISTHKILEGSHAFRKFQLMLEIKGKEAEKKFMGIQKELEKKNNTLLSLQSTLPEKQWKERKAAFEQEVSKFQKEVQERRTALEESHQKAILELQGHVQHILAKLSEKKGFLLTLDHQVTIWGSKEVPDVTEEVITLLNERVSDLAIADQTKEKSNNKEAESTKAL